MKKRTIIICAVALVLIVTAVVVIFNLTKVTYTKQFSYLPKYNNMQVDKYTPPKGNQFGNAVYNVANGDYNSFLTNYEKVLQKDGWKITLDKKPANIEATKAKHIVRINVVKAKAKLAMFVWAK